MPVDAEESMTQSVRDQLSVSVGLLMADICTSSAQAQSRQPQSQQPKKPEWQQASIATGRVLGVVRDERGQGVGGVAISAVGTVIQTAFSDAAGRFTLPLPSGEYVIRAHREGYVSSYRDIVMVRSSMSIKRTITVTRQPVSPAPRSVMIAGVSGATVVPASVLASDPEHPHDETAWRLRHLARPVLRDTGAAVAEAARSQNFRPHTNNFFDWALTNSARLATSLITGPNYTGQVNFVTTSAVDPTQGWSPDGPRNVAYVSLSAPVGGLGDWRVRGAMNTAELSSWVLLGEFTARNTHTHAFTVGMAYSTQTYADPGSAVFTTDQGTTRAVGGVYGSDRWRVTDGLELDYGLRWDRYSYVANAPNMVSPTVGGRVHVGRRLSIVGQAAQRMLAPGSTEFLPPAAAGPWLPPERTFTSLSSTGAFRAERVRHFDLGVEQAFSGGRTVSLRRFHQGTDDQTATIFGLNTGGDLWAAGHYSVASIGGVAIDGWTMRAAGSVSSRLSGSVEYSVGSTQWTPGGSARRVEMLAPSVVRAGTERMQDLLASVDVAIPESDTRLSVVYRVNSAFSRSGAEGTPGTGARFNMQINQALPFQPLRGGRLEVLVAVSNLFRDLRQPGSLFDELLTVAPPTRLLGGVQIRF
jgi:hypothetical protein